MVQSKALNVPDYLESLPPDRREAIAAVRKVILKNLPKGYVEVMAYGMIGYAIPLTGHPAGYKGEPLGIAGLASQKQYMALYLINVAWDKDVRAWFTREYKASGKKLDMGKSCVRFKKLEDLPLDLVGKAIARTPPKKIIEIAQKRK